MTYRKMNRRRKNEFPTMSDLEEKIREIEEKELWTDCVFKVGRNTREIKTFKLHKGLLAMWSPVFRQMFKGNLKNDTEFVVHVHDINPEIFLLFAIYILDERINLFSVEDACALLTVANKYKVKELIRTCIWFIVKYMNATNVFLCYETAVKLKFSVLIERIKSFISRKTAQVLDDPSFENIEFSTLLTILDMNQLSVPEYQLFNKAVHWVDKYFEKKNSTDVVFKANIQRQIVKKIRFLNIGSQEFVAHVTNTGMLTNEEMRGLVMKLNDRDSNPMPPNLSTSLRKFHCPPEMSNHVLNTFRSGALSPTNKDEPNFSIQFSKNTRLLGVSVKTQVNPIRNPAPSTYEENLDVFLIDGNVVHRTSLKATVPYNKVMYVYFEAPIPIQSHKVYKMGVELHKEGIYNCINLKNAEISIGDVNIMFSQCKKSSYRSVILGLLLPKSECIKSTSIF